MTVKPPNNLPRWINVQTEHGPLPALAFVMHRHSRFYVGRLSSEVVADVLAQACGHWGSGAEYLCNTVAHLEQHGIHAAHRVSGIGTAERLGQHLGNLSEQPAGAPCGNVVDGLPSRGHRHRAGLANEGTEPS
jgi:cation transport regulator ChaC